MSKVSETPATAMLKKLGISYTEHVYEYVEHGGFPRAQEAGSCALARGMRQRESEMSAANGARHPRPATSPT